jgi:MoaA/NifB/PqqE/SkfB family radical SAM enzyme
MTAPAKPAYESSPASSKILILSLATACACNCVFCGLPETKPHLVMSRGLLTAAIEGPIGGGRWAEVNLTGGDPLIVPGARSLFSEILARRHFFDRLSVSTAGIPTTSALRGLAILADNMPLEVYVSLDGVGELHDQIRGRRDAFLHADRFIRECAEDARVQLALTCVINRHNADRLDEVADYAVERGIPVSYALVNESDHYITSAPLYSDVSLRADQLDVIADFLIRRSSQRLDEELQSVLSGGLRKLPCRLLRDGLLLTPDGTVSICGTSKKMQLGVMGSLTETEYASAWQAAQARRTDSFVEAARGTCSTCTTNCFAWKASDEPQPR